MSAGTQSAALFPPEAEGSSMSDAGTGTDGDEDAAAETDRVRAHVYVSGTVQGVYYRASTRDAARERGADGWVRYLDDGRVEAAFEGPQDAVEGMVEWCHTGSPAASVDDVSVEYEDPQGEEGFRIRY